VTARKTPIVGYEQILRWTGYQRGKKSRYRIADLVAMSEDHDPFLAEQEGRRAQGEWFAGIWHQFGIGQGTHLRRIHYRLVSASPPVRMWNGAEYQNTRECWHRLILAGANARFLNLIPAGAIEDHRNDPPITFIPGDDVEPDIALVGLPRWGVELSARIEPPDFEVAYAEGRQRYHLEIICEKTTMNDILLPLCEMYHAVLVTASGEVSLTQMEQLVQRVLDDGRPARIFYISDFDPAGATMPVSASRKLEYLFAATEWEDVTVTPIALNIEQVEQYDLSRTPIKESDMRRERFEERHGHGAVELDALEATQPGLLAEIVEEAFAPFFDETLEERVAEQRQALEDACRALRFDALVPFDERREALEERVNALRSSVEAEIAALDEEARALGAEIIDALAAVMPDVTAFPVPQPVEADESDLPIPLYDGAREYLEQLAAYKAFQGKAAPILD
jgi:hypothetical protein